MADERLEAGEHARRTIRQAVGTIDVVRPRQMQLFFGNRLALVLQQPGGVFPEDLCGSSHRGDSNIGYLNSSTAAAATAAATISSIGSASSACSTTGRRARVA